MRGSFSVLHIRRGDRSSSLLVGDRGEMTPQERTLQRALKWQKDNPERRKEIRAKWIAGNLEKMRGIRKAWKLKNKEKVREDRATWMRTHPEIRSANEAARRTRITSAGGRFNAKQISELAEKQDWKCNICLAEIKGRFHRDHVIPVCRGGSSDISNIQLLCPPCNMKKGAK